MKSYGVSIQMRPLQQYFHMVLFIEYVVLTFECVDEILWCYHSNETSLAFQTGYYLFPKSLLGGQLVIDCITKQRLFI